jgi:hypothetical protein
MADDELRWIEVVWFLMICGLLVLGGTWILFDLRRLWSLGYYFGENRGSACALFLGPVALIISTDPDNCASS